MSDRPADFLSEEEVEESWQPIRVEEQTVDGAVWVTWATSARSANDKGLFWGATVGLVIGLVSAGLGLLLLLPSPASAGVLVYAPLVGWAGWSIASIRARRRHFRPTAHEMRNLIVPDLLRHPSDDELRTLASTGSELFRNEYTVARVEDRLNLYAIRVFEYAPEHLPWGGGSEGAISGGGGGDGGGGC